MGLKNAILVAGGAGYIGSHTVRFLRNAGKNVIVLDDLSEGRREAVCGVPFIKANINDAKALEEVFTQNDVNAVIHFAAFAYVGESVLNPQKYYQNNVAAALTLLSAMIAHNVKKIVFSSSCATYGNPVYIPIDEKHPQNPINPYGATKFMVERILADYNAAYGLNYMALRYFNAAGAHPDGDIGESHRVETHLIPLILKTFTGEKQNIQIFGDDYDTKDGTCIRDYIHVCDLAFAHNAAVEALNAGSPSMCVNMGCGRGFSVKEIIKACEEVTGKKAHVLTAPRRPGDPSVLTASSALSRETLGFNPRYTDIREIIETAWEWEKNRRF
ncbi:MAG: UDP-glucose 4-epimerase GalE [Spirochaetaceae bacterium]|jgi:UDP-glucose 4-epimerase|nr:UDP-glucose 4-epimerase GalE [Spirochaetaceae bacterium]